MARARRQRNRSDLLTSLDEATRRIGAQSVLLSQAIAARAGLHSTDMECLDLLHLDGPATPGRLAELTGLTTGAVTALIDRLERAGFVRRVPNPQDRRSILVEPLDAGPRLLQPLFEPLARAMSRVQARYADAELAIVLDYLTRALEAGAEHMRWLDRTASGAIERGPKARTYVSATRRKRPRR
jgi:DNA-binding MarR family transcriptional regulator